MDSNNEALPPPSLDPQPLDSESDDNDDEKWQGGRADFHGSILYLFERKILCDVELVVGSGSEEERIPAHKVILSARSPVFCALCRTRPDCNAIIVHPEIEPNAFKTMLRFLYEDDPELLNFETVNGVLFAAKKYSVAALEDCCVDLLYENLFPQNAVSILIQAQLHKMEKLTEDCLDVIAEGTCAALDSDDFLKIDLDTLCSILARSDLRIDEILLFDAVNRWAVAACAKKDCSSDSTQKRYCLDRALYLLRFPLMKPEDFATKVVTSGLLSDAEVISVTQHFLNKGDCIFNSTPRRAFLVLRRFQHEVTGGCFGSFFRTDFHKLRLHTSHKIKLVGIGLYALPGSKFDVNIILQHSGDSSKEMNHCGSYKCSDKIHRIFFPEPYEMICSEDCDYLLQVKIEAPYDTYGCGGVSSETIAAMIDDKEERVTINFKHSEYVRDENERGHRTDVNSGQIPELLFQV